MTICYKYTNNIHNLQYIKQLKLTVSLKLSTNNKFLSLIKPVSITQGTVTETYSNHGNLIDRNEMMTFLK